MAPDPAPRSIDAETGAIHGAEAAGLTAAAVLETGRLMLQRLGESE